VKVLFPTERGRRISPRQIDDRFAASRDEAGLPGYLNPTAFATPTPPR